MNTQLSYLGFATFMGWITYEYIVICLWPKVSSLFNKIYYDYHFISDGTDKLDLNEKLENLDLQPYLRHKELERTIENLMEKIDKIEDK